MFAGFASGVHDTGGARIAFRAAGQGRPLLLLHGWPQTGAMWAAAAGELARDHAVVVPDLRGYGASLCRDADFTFRAMAADMLALMAARGHRRFTVLAHDRGARAAHRLALDRPGAVAAVALLDILPTLDVWASMDAALALRYYHWGFLAQPGGLPELLIGRAPVAYLHHALGGLGGAGFAPGAMAEYEAAALRPSVIAAWCADYRAAAGPDLDHDRADLGRRLDIPALVLWGSRGVVGRGRDPLAVWRDWFRTVEGRAVEAGHFLVEERAAEVLAELRGFLARTT